MEASKNLITNLLGIRAPIIAAPMAGPSGGALAAQVTNGGGFGFLQAGYEDASALRRELNTARSMLKESHSKASLASTAPENMLRVGAGFLGWVLDKSYPKTDNGSIEIIDAALEACVQAVWFSFGPDLGRYVSYVRTEDSKRNADRARPHKTLVFVQVGSIEEARRAVYDWNVDILVVQGIESGGHGYSYSPSLLSLLPEVLDMLRQPSPEGSRSTTPPVLAAGGLTVGSQVAAILTMGAAGAVLGTRFLLTPEARYTQTQKDALVAASGESTVRTTAFDALRGTTGWPDGIDGRALRNTIISRIFKGESIEDTRPAFEKATREGDANGMLVWSGTGIGLVREIKPAADVVAEIHEDLIAHLHRAGNLLQS